MQRSSIVGGSSSARSIPVDPGSARSLAASASSDHGSFLAGAAVPTSPIPPAVAAAAAAKEEEEEEEEEPDDEAGVSWGAGPAAPSPARSLSGPAPLAMAGGGRVSPSLDPEGGAAAGPFLRPISSLPAAPSLGLGMQPLGEFSPRPSVDVAPRRGGNRGPPKRTSSC